MDNRIINNEKIDFQGEFEKIAKVLETILVRSKIILMDSINQTDEKSKDLQILQNSILMLPDVNSLETKQKIVTIFEEMSILKTQCSLFIEKEALKSLGFFDDMSRPTILWRKSEEDRKVFGERYLYSKKTPDFFANKLPGDVKVDFKGDKTRKQVTTEVKKDWLLNENESAVIILINRRTIESYVKRTAVEIVGKIFLACESLEKAYDIIYEKSDLLKEIGVVYNKEEVRGAIREALDKVNVFDRSKFMQQEMLDLLAEKRSVGNEEDYIREFKSSLNTFVLRLMDSCIGAPEMKEKLEETFKREKEDDYMIEIKTDLENEIKRKIEMEGLRNEMIMLGRNNKEEEESLDKLENQLRETEKQIEIKKSILEETLKKEYSHGNLHNLPLGVKKEVITGEEEVIFEEQYEDLEKTLKVMLEIRRVGLKNSNSEEEKLRLITLKREKQILKTSPYLLDKKDLLARSVAITEIDKEIEVLRSKMNEELTMSKINSDGSYTVEETLVDKLRVGTCKKFMGELSCNHLEVVEAIVNVGEVMLERWENKELEEKEALEFVLTRYKLRLDELQTMKKLDKNEELTQNELAIKKGIRGFAKSQSDLRVTAIKKLGLRSFSEVLDLEVCEITIKREVKKVFYEKKRNLPSGDWSYLIKELDWEIPVGKTLSFPKIDTSGFSDIREKQGMFEVVKKDFEKVVLSHMKKDKDLILLSEEAEILRGIIMLGKPRNSGDNKKESPYSIAYYKNKDIMMMIGNQTNDYNSASIRLLIKAKEFRKPFLCLNYTKFKIANSEESFYLSDTFRLNKKFTENWLEIYGAALGLSSIILSYGDEKNWKSAALKLLRNPKKQMIDMLDVNYFVLGNATKRLNFGGKAFETKLEVISNEIRVSDWINRITSSLEKVTIESKMFFQNGKLINGKSQSRMDIGDGEVKAWTRMKILEMENELKKRSERLKEIGEILGDEEGKSYYSTEFLQKISDEMGKILREMKINKSVLESLKERTGVEEVTIRNKQIMLSLVYIRQILPKAIPNDERKMKSDFFKRESLFNKKALADPFSNRNTKKFALVDDMNTFFDFLLETDETDIWSGINTSLPGFTYFMQRKMIKKHMEKEVTLGVNGTDIGVHPVYTSVSSKTNYIVDEKEYIYNVKRQKMKAEAMIDNLKKIKEEGKESFKKFAETLLKESIEKNSNEEKIKQEIRRETSRKVASEEGVEDKKASKLFKSIEKMDEEAIANEVKKLLKELKGKGKEYYRLRSEFTADALYRESQEMKKKFNLPDDAEVTMADLIVHDVVYKGGEVILTLELKEQKGGKRAFFVQNISARNLNQFYDSLSTPLLKSNKFDGITPSGEEKYLKFQQMVSKLGSGDYAGLTGDKAKYGDTHPLRPFVEGILAKYDEGYISVYEAIASLHAVRGLFNRKLLVPKDILEKYSEVDKNALKRKETSVVKSEYTKPLIDYFLDLNAEVKENNNAMQEKLQHPFLRNSAAGGLVREIQEKNHGLLKEAGFTLGVLNMESTLIALCAVEFHKLVSKSWFNWVKMIVLVHSDDTMHFFNTLAADMPFVRKNVRINKKKMENMEKQGKIYKILDDAKRIEEDRLSGGKLMSLIQTAISFLSFRMVGQMMSLAKCSLSNDYAEMLQVYNLITKEEDKNKENNIETYLNITVPLIRYAVNLGNRGTFTSYSDALRQRITASLDFLRNGGNVIGCFAIQYIANVLTALEFNFDEIWVSNPPEVQGAMFILAEDLLNQGFLADTCRHMTNEKGRRIYEQIAINPNIDDENDDNPEIKQGESTIVSKSNGNYKERLRNPKINLSSQRDSATRFGYLFKDGGLKSTNLGGAIKEIKEKYFLEELLGSAKGNVMLLRVITKHNSKMFNESRTTIPRFLIERSQMGFREREVYIDNFKGLKKTKLRLKAYYDEIVNTAESKETIEINRGFKLMEEMYKEDMENFKNNVWVEKSVNVAKYYEPNIFVKKLNLYSSVKFDEYIPALGVCAESKVEVTEENSLEIAYESKTKVSRPVVLEKEYQSKIFFMSHWLKILLGNYWEIEDKSIITGTKEILKKYIEERANSLIYKGYGLNLKDNIILMYKHNYSMSKSSEISNESVLEIKIDYKITGVSPDFSLNKSLAIVETERVLSILNSRKEVLNGEEDTTVDKITISMDGIECEVGKKYAKKTGTRVLKMKNWNRFFMDGFISCLMRTNSGILIGENSVMIEWEGARVESGESGMVEMNGKASTLTKVEIGNLIRVARYFYVILVKKEKTGTTDIVHEKGIIRKLRGSTKGEFMDTGGDDAYLRMSFKAESGTVDIRLKDSWEGYLYCEKGDNCFKHNGRIIYPTIFDFGGINYNFVGLEFDLLLGKKLKKTNTFRRPKGMINKYNALELSGMMSIIKTEVEESSVNITNKMNILLSEEVLDDIRQIYINSMTKDLKEEKKEKKLYAYISKNSKEIETMSELIGIVCCMRADIGNYVELMDATKEITDKLSEKMKSVKYTGKIMLQALKMELSKSGSLRYVSTKDDIITLGVLGTIYTW